jgi:uncharacterized protein YegL
MLTLVVDRSGSMTSISEPMERGIADLVRDQAQGEEPCVVTLAQFDDHYEVVADSVPAEQMPPYHLEPGGGTALFDAIGRTIGMVHRRIENMTPEDRPTTVIIAVITDGGENSSQEWSQTRLLEAIKVKTAEGWHFTFLGANVEALKEGLRLGIDVDALLTWDGSDDGAASAMKSLSSSVQRLQSGRSDGIQFTEDERLASSPALFAFGTGRPHLFLEVDGVLNVLEKDVGGDAEMFDDFANHVVPFDTVAKYRRSVTVCLSPSMGGRLARLAVDMQWVTSWQHRAGSSIAPYCGLPRNLPVLERDDEGEEWEVDWKFRAIRRLVEDDPRPFVWIDGDIDFLQDLSVTAKGWAKSIGVPSLLIAPDRGTGLLPRHLDAVEDFVRQHGDDARGGQTPGS